MSIIRIDGFDGYGTPDNQNNCIARMFSSGWSNGGFAGGFSNSTRTGIGFSYSPGWYGDSWTAFDVASGCVAGFALNPGPLGFRRVMAMSYDNYAGSLDHALVMYQNPTGALSLFHVASGAGFPGTLLAHSPVNAVYANTWHYIEVKRNGGYVEVRVDGNTVISTTISTSIPGVNLFYMWGAGVGNPSSSFDDLYLLSMDGVGHSDFLGDCVVHTLFPLADAGPNDCNQFGGGITHASAVNGLPYDETSAYLYSNTSGNEDLFTLTELPTDMIDILALQVNVRAKKDSAGVAQYYPSLKSGTTLSHGSAKTPTTSFLEQHQIWESDPNGGSWTKVSAQAAEIGFKVV